MFAYWPALAPYAATLGALFYYDVPAYAFDGGADGSSLPDNGNAAPLVIVIHGLGDEADSWRRLVPLLSAAGCRTIAPDLPGFGRSEGKGSFARHRDAILAVLDGAGAASSRVPVMLAGSSMGAIVAEAAALERPEVKGIALIDGCLPAGTGLPLPLTLMAFAGRRWYRSFRQDHEGAWRSLEPYYAALHALPAEDRAFLRERVVDRVTSARQEASYFSTLRSMLWAWAFRASALGRRVASWPGTVALVWGEQDRVVPLAQAEYFRTLRPDARLAVIEGAGHLPHQEQPEKTARALLAFLRDCIVQ